MKSLSEWHIHGIYTVHEIRHFQRGNPVELKSCSLKRRIKNIQFLLIKGAAGWFFRSKQRPFKIHCVLLIYIFYFHWGTLGFVFCKQKYWVWCLKRNLRSISYNGICLSLFFLGWVCLFNCTSQFHIKYLYVDYFWSFSFKAKSSKE